MSEAGVKEAVRERYAKAARNVGATDSCCGGGLRAGPSGKAYGLDMTDDMPALARENQRKAGAATRASGA